MEVRRAIDVAGIVQGVGFRPYVFRLATERGLAGYITNTAAGVSIEVQGARAAVDDFVVRLPQEAPPLARITGVAVRELPCNGDAEFRIVASRRGEAVRTLISPDVALCAGCLRELFDPADRRFHYPFINCTNCGPRFTITRNIPYDRPFTSMAVFPMCPACRAEYEDPRDRRFHAQPNACWTCGPQVALWDREGNAIFCEDPIREAIARLHAGAIVAVKGLGGFHLAADATNHAAVELLRERKRRVEKPFAVMAPNLETIARFCEIDDAGRALLTSVQRPIVLLPRKPGTPVAEAVAPFNRDLGVFLPYTPLHHLLLRDTGFLALVMTSANLGEEPIVIDNREAVVRLHELADCLLVHDRDILLRCDDSVVRPVAGAPRVLRRSRGYVPMPVFLAEEVPPILAVGGELKNTICLTKGKHAFLSQHVGDLENLESYKFFEEAAGHLQKILEIEPETVAYDLHPDYFSTRWALGVSGRKLIGVQHHHAHIASCMAENGLVGRVIGFAFDGTGYGTDGRIWGGEVLLADFAGFERAAHLDYVPLPGSAAAVREPWRMAVACLHHHFGRAFLGFDLAFLRERDPRSVETVLRMVERGVNSPLTSSCGRLFDAVAALIGLRSAVNYEAQAAIELEMLIGDCADRASYPLALEERDGVLVIGSLPLFEALLRDLKERVSPGAISRRFHMALVDVMGEVARRLRARTGLDRVCLSGGTFQNAFLLRHALEALAADGFRVFTHSAVPAGDGGLSLGQALVAAHQ